MRGLTSLKNEFKKYKLATRKEKITKLLLSSEPSISLIKLCDRLHNMQTLDAKKPAHRLSKAEETLAIYVSLARELGLKRLAKQLEKMAQKYVG